LGHSVAVNILCVVCVCKYVQMLIRCYVVACECFLCRKAVLIFGWVIFAYVAYETSQVQIDFTEFDPYTELGIDRVPSCVSIKSRSSSVNTPVL